MSGGCSRRPSAFRAIWDLEATRLRGDPDEIGATLATSLATRDAITFPLSHLVILAPQLQSRIDRAAQAIYTMDTATGPASRTEDRLEEQRAAAKSALDDPANAMATLLRTLGAGLPKDTRPVRRRVRAAGRSGG